MTCEDYTSFYNLLINEKGIVFHLFYDVYVYNLITFLCHMIYNLFIIYVDDDTDLEVSSCISGC